MVFYLLHENSVLTSRLLPSSICYQKLYYIDIHEGLILQNALLAI